METNAAATAVARGGGAPAKAGGRAPARGRPGLTLLAVALGVMMVALDGTIVAVANPAIQEHLNASLAGIQWVTNAYLLALAVSLMTMGKLGDRFGHKKVFMTGVTGFALSSAAIGLSGTVASSLGLVIAFRALQGVFGAMLQPTALALLRNTFPPEKLNRAIGVWGAVIGASTAAGPIVGGLLVQHISWESCFYVNVPVGAAALIMSLIVLRETRPSPAASSFDVPGIAALSGALFLLIWGLIKGSSYGWGSARTLAFLGGALVVGLLFVLREHRARQPLLPLRLFRSASLSAGVALVVLLMFALFGLSGLGAGSSPNDTIVWFILLGLGLSPVMVGATDVIVGNAPVELAGVAGGLQSTAMQVGGTLGTAVLGAVMSARISSLLPASWAAAHLPALSPDQLAGVKSAVSVGAAPVTSSTPPQVARVITAISHATFASGMHTAFLVAAGVALAGTLIGLLIRPGHGGAEAA